MNDADYSFLLGELKGREAPGQDFLRRLNEISVRIRLTWTPATERRPAMWWVHEIRPGLPGDDLRRGAGKARLERFERWPAALQRTEWPIRDQAIDWVNGYYGVSSFTERDWENPDLVLGEIKESFTIDDAKWQEAMKKLCGEAVQGEMDLNPEFRGETFERAWEVWPYLVKRPHSVVVDGLRS